MFSENKCTVRLSGECFQLMPSIFKIISFIKILPLNIASKFRFMGNQMLVQFDLNVFRGRYDFRSSIYCVYVEASLGGIGEGIVALYFMLTGSIFQFVIE